MKRTQLQLPEEMWEWLRQKAHEQKISIAALIRQAVDVYKSIGIGKESPCLTCTTKSCRYYGGHTPCDDYKVWECGTIIDAARGEKK